MICFLSLRMYLTAALGILSRYKTIGVCGPDFIVAGVSFVFVIYTVLAEAKWTKMTDIVKDHTII